jgi:uncharacterized protein YkwD/protoporphyrinogen oxidase
VTTNNSRREFLKQAALLLAGLGSASISESGLLLPAHAKGGYKIGGWTGDDFALGHKIRDGKPPKLPTRVTETVDFVIVGGGLSGLASAHYLRDSNFLLLEQYPDLGGHARGSSYRGIGYSYGAAYLSILDGAIGELVNDLGLKPITLEDSKDAWYQDGKWLRGTGGGDDSIIFKEFKRLKTEHKEFFGKWNGLYPELNEFPEFKKLDDILLEEVLKSYDPKFVALIDNFTKSALNAGIRSVSALSGLSTIEDVINPTYLLPGGNPALTSELIKRLTASHGDKVKPSAFVWDIKIKENGATVTYSLKDGSMHVADCKHVIFAIPHLVSARIAKNISDKAKAAMFRFRYGAYMVANVLCKKRVFDGTYDNFLPAPFAIADITPAETAYMLNGTYKPEMGSVLTCYSPYEPGSTGRTLLYQGNKKKMAEDVMTELKKLVPQLEGNVEEVVLTRWGHALAITKPQYFKYVGELQAQETASYSFAHSSAHGLPGAEAAVQGAKHAVEKAKAVKVSAKPIYSTPRLTKNAVNSLAGQVVVSLAVLATMVPLAISPAEAYEGNEGARIRQNAPLLMAAKPTSVSKKAATSSAPAPASDKHATTGKGATKSPAIAGGTKGPAAKPPAGRSPLVYAMSMKEVAIPVMGAQGIPAVGNIGGEQVKGTLLTLVRGIGPGHDCGLVTGDLLLMIDNKVTESPEMTTQLVTEYSGIKTILRYARKNRNVLEVKETQAYWTIPKADSSTMPSSGFDDTQTYGAVTKVKPEEVKTEDLEDYMLQVVNNDRVMNGDAPKLRKSDTLTEMARAYAADMVARKFFGHKDPDGRDMVARAKAAGIEVPISENIAWVKGKTLEPREMVKRCQKNMMNEPANVPDNHRGHILDADNKCVGIGVCIMPDGGLVTVQEFSHEDLP